MQERRLYPRYPAEWSVQLSHDAVAWHDAETCNASVAGLGLTVSRSAVVALAHNGNLLMPGDSIQVQFVGGSGSPGIEAPLECLIKQVRRVSQAEYVVGGEFVALSSVQARQLQQAVDQLARKRGR